RHGRGRIEARQGLRRRRRGINKRPMPRLIKTNRWANRDTVALARELLGKVLVVRHSDADIVRRRITEVEAYDGPEDRACHASRGRTGRTEVLFGPPGHWYVYLCYGIHEMLNLVTGPADYPAAVLIRGLEVVSGPGRVTKRLQIDRRLNGALAEPASGLHLEDHGIKIPRGRVHRGPRVGIDYAGPIWTAKPWRFWIEKL